ncbi:hypothetical protein BDW66DRAFT_161956 [Aspergillus desertorum]
MTVDLSSASLTCSTCLEPFRRAVHLERHALTREDLTPSAPRTCPLIRATDDDAKPYTCHFCSALYRRGYILKRRFSGKREQACDLCTARKRACSGFAVLGVTAAGSAAQGITGQISAQAQGIVLNANDQSTSIHGLRFGFLVNFTKANGLDEADSYKSESTTINPSPSLLEGKGGADWGCSQGTTASNPFDCYLVEFETGPWARRMWDSLQHILDDRTAQHSRTTASEWFEFFSPANTTWYLHLFWIDAHACPLDGRIANRQNGSWMWLRELIFSHSLFLESSRLGSRNENLLRSRENTQIPQATYFMCLLQKWKGSIQAKLGMPRHRFTAFVANTRTFNHVFLLDSAFVIFHNSVPRMVLQEITTDLTCPEDVALKSHPPCTVLLLTDCVRNLCAETPDPDVIAHLSHESALNLFTIATGQDVSEVTMFVADY